jgi:hypothetical protein
VESGIAPTVVTPFTVSLGERVRVTYRCPEGHAMRFAFPHAAPEIPTTWPCSKCDLPAELEPSAG